ncbi:MAG: SMP-30/gluconolactonase/LRE family protein [Clostridiales bacterium]|nr:SMP-30/gluconolactonase/LRE family protein [Clostridiales bacterium]
MSGELEFVLDAKSIVAEGSFWDERKHLLIWIDIFQYKVHVYNPLNNHVYSIDTGQYVGSIALREKGGAVVALHNGFYFLNLDDGKLTFITDPEKHLPNNRFNDGKCDCMGRFWAGTMSNNENEGKGTTSPEGSLYCLDVDLSVRYIFGNVTISNGITWSLDNKTMYYIDTPTRQVAAFDFSPDTGEINNKRTVITTPPDKGCPDGMTIDEEGMLWIALWGGYGVTRWNPQNGKLLKEIEIPVKNVTCCTFGGDNLDELYITTSQIGINSNDPGYKYAGGIFKIKPGIRGIPAFRFKG